VPSSMWPLFQAVFDHVGPDDGRFEDPAVGNVPTQACAEDATSILAVLRSVLVATAAVKPLTRLRPRRSLYWGAPPSARVC
ncbi:MAG: hypothetical protein M3069_32140, partial [Chloroflexota bacterium]|nr:hypothetical protein [Chloroflexota bacterium]